MTPQLVEFSRLLIDAAAAGGIIWAVYLLGGIKASLGTVVRVQDAMMKRQIHHEDSDADLFRKHGERLARVEVHVGLVDREVENVHAVVDAELNDRERSR